MTQSLLKVKLKQNDIVSRTSLQMVGFLRCNFFGHLKGSSTRDEYKSTAEVEKINLKKFFAKKEEHLQLPMAIGIAFLLTFLSDELFSWSEAE